MPMDYGFNFEAWTLPNIGAGSYQYKFDITKSLESWEFNLRFSGNGEGNFEIDRTFPRLSDLITVDSADHSNDVGSMIRVKRGNTYIKGGDFVLYELNRKNDSDKGTYPAILQGPEYLLDLTKVRRFDDPKNPSKDPDWEYGSPTIIRPLGDETVKEVQQIWRSAGMSSGTWDLVFGGDTTVAMPWDVDSSTMETELEDLTTITDVDVSGSGTSLDPWVITYIDPSGDVALLTVGTNGTNGSFSLDEITPGGSLSPRPWHQSYHPVTGVQHGTYQTFAIDTTTVFPGDTYSLKLDADSLPFPTDYSGAQVIENVVGGRSYNAKIPVLSEGIAQTVRLVIRDMQENFIAASPDVLVPADTWTWLEVPNPFVLGDNIEELIYRVGIIENTNANPVYIAVEQAQMIPGYYAAPVGAIMLDQIQALQLEGDLDWVTPTWTDTLDSDGNAWDQDRQWKITRKQSMLQVLEYAIKWGYRFSFYYDDGSGEFRWDLFNPGAGPVVSGVSLKARESVGGGDNPIRFPKASLFDAEGAFGEWAEYEDTTLSTAWGRIHGHLRDDRGLDQAGLLDLATEQVEAAKRGADAASLTFQNPEKLPLDAYQLGDQVEFDSSPLGTKRVRVVTMVNVSKGPGEASPKYTVHGDTEVFSSGGAAMASNVRTLIRKVDSLGQGAGIEKRERTWDPAMFNFGSTTIGAGGGNRHVLVASSNASDRIQAIADYVCDGVNDEVEIQQALDSFQPGRFENVVELSEGSFNIGTGDNTPTNTTPWAFIRVPANVTLKGQSNGRLQVGGQTYLQYDGFNGIYGILETNRRQGWSIVSLAGRATIQNINVDAWSAIHCVTIAGSYAKVIDCYLETSDLDCVTTTEGWDSWEVTNTYLQAGTGMGESFMGSGIRMNGIVRDTLIRDNFFVTAGDAGVAGNTGTVDVKGTNVGFFFGAAGSVAKPILGGTGTNEMHSQSVTFDRNVYGVRNAIMYLERVGTPGDGLTFTIRDGNDGTIRSTVTFTNAEADEWQFKGWWPIPFFDEYNPSTPWNQTFTIQVERTGARDASNYWQLRTLPSYDGGATSADLPGGTSYTKDSGVWSDNSVDLDFCVEAYTTSAGGSSGRNRIYDNDFSGGFYSAVIRFDGARPGYHAALTFIERNRIWNGGYNWYGPDDYWYKNGLMGGVVWWAPLDANDPRQLTQSAGAGDGSTILISNNYFESHDPGCIVMRQVPGVMILGNWLEQGQDFSIKLTATGQAQIKDNLLYEVDNNLAGLAHVNLVDCVETQIMTNKFHQSDVGGGPVDYAVDIDADCVDVIVVGNDARNAHDVSLVNDAGTGTLLTWPAGGAGIGDNYV